MEVNQEINPILRSKLKISMQQQVAHIYHKRLRHVLKPMIFCFNPPLILASAFSVYPLS